MPPHTYPQSPCYQCPTGINAINGRWCPKLRCYVEYAIRRPCQPSETQSPQP